MKRQNHFRKRMKYGLCTGLAVLVLASCANAGASQEYLQTAVLAESRRDERFGGAAAAQPSQAVQAAAVVSVGFDAQDKWDWADGSIELNVTTGSVPQEGVIFTADLLVPALAKPQFRGRMNIEATLYIGPEKRWAHAEEPAQVRAINFAEQVTRDGKTWYRTRIAVPFAGSVGTQVEGVWTESVPFRQVVTQAVSGVQLRIAGTQCDYQGTLRFENPALGYSMGSGDGVSVNSTVSRGDTTRVSVDGDALTLENGTRVTLPQVTLADPKATAATVKTAQYLAALGKTDHVVFGHQDSSWSKSGTAATPLNGLTASDVEDITGSPAGMVGLDGLSLVGLDFSAARWNSTFARNGKPAVDLSAAGEAAANVKAAAYLTNESLSRGALVTLSCHMPNFSQVKVRSDYQADREPAYARYDFTSSAAKTLGGDTMKQILPGGAYNAPFTAYLDMIADYASQVSGAILFRPFHEGTGSWFWWGTSSCDAETYQKVFRYTVEYLRDQKQVHNLLYVYSPDGAPGFFTECGRRYPGDAYVDVIGLDIYQTDPAADSSQWFAQVRESLKQLGQYASQHGKVLALAEVGVNTSTPAAGDVATGLARTGCPDPKWFEKLLDEVSALPVSYLMAWSNTTEMFHMPFVRAVNEDGSLYGHELLDDFLRFYNDRRSVFASNQAEIVCGFQ